MATPDHTVLARLSVAPKSDSTPLALDPSHSADIAKLPLQRERETLDVVVTMLTLAQMIRANNECREAKQYGLPMNAPPWPLKKEFTDGLHFAIVHLSDYARMLGGEQSVDE